MFNWNIYEKNWYSKTCSMGTYMRKAGVVKICSYTTHYLVGLERYTSNLVYCDTHRQQFTV